MPGWWDLAYCSGAPWDSGLPADELVVLVQSGRMKAGRARDIGCGTGTNVLYLAEKGFDVSGVDTSKVAIREATANARERGLRCSFYVLDFTEPQAVSKAFSTLLNHADKMVRTTRTAQEKTMDTYGEAASPFLIVLRASLLITM